MAEHGLREALALQRALYGSRARKVERLAGGRPGRVLDVGCGSGRDVNALVEVGCDAAGVDAGRIRSTARRSKPEHP